MTAPAAYHGTNQQQLKDGGRCPAKDCVPTSFATVTDLVTAGSVILRPPSIRIAAMVGCLTGLTQQQAANGVEALSGLKWTPRYNLTDQQVVDAIRAYGAIEASLAYRRILSYSFRNSATFTGGHGTTIVGVYTNTAGQLRFIWGDPLADGRLMSDGKHAHLGFQDVPASVILGAMRDRGGGLSNITVPPDSRSAPKRTVSETPLHTAPSATATIVRTLTSSTGVRVRRPVAGGPWTIGTKHGTGWWEVDQVLGAPLNPVLYAAGGRLR